MPIRLKYYISISITCLVLVVSTAVFSQKTILISDQSERYLIDSSNFESLKINQDTLVIPDKKRFFHNQNVKEDYWYKFKVKNNTGKSAEWILVSYFYSLDEIDLNVIDEKGNIERQLFRDTCSVFDRQIKHKQPSFSISLSANETKTFYVRIKNESTYEYSFGIFSTYSFIANYFIESVLVGLFYGFILFILLYSTINYLFFRNKIILLYIFFILSQFIHMLFRDGYGVMLLPSIEYADLIKNLSRAGVSVFIVLYTATFLSVKRKSLEFYIIITFIISRIIFALVMLENTSTVTFHFELFAILFSTILTFVYYIKYNRDAIYLVIGLSILCLCYFTFYISVVWDSSLGSIGYNGMYFGIALESIFTSLALTERFKKIQIENYKKHQLNSELEIEVKNRTELIQFQNKILEEKNSEINAFLYSAYHDLSGPIKTIQGLIYLAKKDSEANIPHLIELIDEKITHLEYNIIDLNSVSLLKNKGVRLSSVNFEKLHESLIKKHHASIEKNKVKVYLSCDVKEPFIFDYYSIELIYHHLLSNAVKFSDSKKQPYVSINISKSGNEIKMIFKDNGIGINENEHKKIFKMFYRGNYKSNNDIGIGLYIVQLAVEKINGNISLSSKEGEGTTFEITFKIDENRMA